MLAKCSSCEAPIQHGNGRPPKLCATCRITKRFCGKCQKVKAAETDFSLNAGYCAECARQYGRARRIPTFLKRNGLPEGYGVPARCPVLDIPITLDSGYDTSAAVEDTPLGRRVVSTLASQLRQYLPLIPLILADNEKFSGHDPEKRVE